MEINPYNLRCLFGLQLGLQISKFLSKKNANSLLILFGRLAEPYEKVFQLFF